MPAKRRGSGGASSAKRSKNADKDGEAGVLLDLVQKSIDTVRVLCADMVQKANSGHPGLAAAVVRILSEKWMTNACFAELPWDAPL
jgi:hypothetical protein